MPCATQYFIKGKTEVCLMCYTFTECLQYFSPCFWVQGIQSSEQMKTPTFGGSYFLVKGGRANKVTPRF